MTRILALQRLTVAKSLDGKIYGSALSAQPTACEVCNN
jgi:hypothetical protein